MQRCVDRLTDGAYHGTAVEAASQGAPVRMLSRGHRTQRALPSIG